MKKLINKVLKKLGFAILSKKILTYQTVDQIKSLHDINDADVAYLRGKLDAGLKETLIRENKTEWLDIGCGGNLEPNFFYIDTFPEGIVAEREKYFRVDIVNATDFQLERIGKFDLVRMQHVFEHFTPEDGIRVLGNCAKILKPDGYILITTPDLKRFVHMYLAGTISDNEWALNRINKNSPASFYFSIFAHSMLYEQHKWCYDAEGLLYQLNATDKFKNMRELPLNDELSNIPFTHNKPGEDVCVIAQLK